MLEQIINTKNDPHWIADRREQVGLRLKSASPAIKDNDLTGLTVSDLRLLFKYYDELFFAAWFAANYRGQVKFSLSHRLTKSAGITICPKNLAALKPEELSIEIRLGVDFFFNFDQVQGQVTVGGLEVKNSLQALLLVFEHELCHLIEFVLYHRSSCKGKRFKAIANNCFAHTASTHQLPTYRQLANKQLGIAIGDKVAFAYENRQLVGMVSNITKNATVMVPDRRGLFRDQKGKRYSKYYVSLKALAKK